MKGAIEYFMVMFLVMFSILLIFSFIGVLSQIHSAHNYRDRVVAQIENFEGDTAEVKRIMASDKLCDSCSYQSFIRDDRITVIVSYQLKISVLDFVKNVQLLGMTQIGGDGRLSFFFWVEIFIDLVYSRYTRGDIMLLTIDVGNSNTVFIIYDGDIIVSETRLITLKKDFGSYYSDNLKDIKSSIDSIIISCVVPVVLENISKACESSLGIVPSIVNAENMKNFEIMLENPLEIGADFIATSIGALTKYSVPVIVADIGSATKLTFTDVNRRFMGGVILPGLGTSVKGLTEFIPHLPEVALEVPSKVVGDSTIGAIQSGIMYGLIAQIEGIAGRMEHEMGVSCVKILTGGYARLIKDYLPEFIYDDTLLNDGLHTIYKEEMLKK